MIVEFTQLPVSTEKSDVFEAGWAKAEAILVAQPGYISHRIGRIVETPDVYVLEIAWASLEAHVDGFAKSPQFADFIAFFAPHLSGEASVIHFTPRAA